MFALCNQKQQSYSRIHPCLFPVHLLLSSSMTALVMTALKTHTPYVRQYYIKIRAVKIKKVATHLMQ